MYMKIITVKNFSNQYFKIEGLASTSDIDSYNEVIIQEGIDLSYLSSQGIPLDFEHGEVIGKITKALVSELGLWVEGIVYWNHPFSQIIYDRLLNTLPFESPIKLSVEIEDPVYNSQGDTIKSGKLYAVAICGLFEEAANSHTFIKLLKSLKQPQIINEIYKRASLDPIFKLNVLSLFIKK